MSISVLTFNRFLSPVTPDDEKLLFHEMPQKLSILCDSSSVFAFYGTCMGPSTSTMGILTSTTYRPAGLPVKKTTRAKLQRQKHPPKQTSRYKKQNRTINTRRRTARVAYLAAALRRPREDLSLLRGGHSRVQGKNLELPFVAEMGRLPKEVSQPATCRRRPNIQKEIEYRRCLVPYHAMMYDIYADQGVRRRSNNATLEQNRERYIWTHQQPSPRFTYSVCFFFSNL